MGMDESSNSGLGSALHRAVARCDEESAKYLVGHGASLSSKDFANRTPLDVAHELLFSFKCAAIQNGSNQNSQKVISEKVKVERIIRFLEDSSNERVKIRPLVNVMFCIQKLTETSLELEDAKSNSDDDETTKEAAEKREEKRAKAISEAWRKIYVESLIPFLFVSRE